MNYNITILLKMVYAKMKISYRDMKNNLDPSQSVDDNSLLFILNMLKNFKKSETYPCYRFSHELLFIEMKLHTATLEGDTKELQNVQRMKKNGFKSILMIVII